METTVNQRIGDIISSLKLTKNAFAEKLGVAGSVIYNILSSRNKPSFDLLEKIISLFDISPEYLVTGKGEMFSSKKKNVDIYKSSENENLIFDEKGNIIRDDYDLLKMLIALNPNIREINEAYNWIEIDFSLLHTYAGHYNILTQTSGFLAKYRNKQITMFELQEKFKTEFKKVKELYNILKPYAKTISELSVKVSEFDDKNDCFLQYDESNL